MGINNRQRRAAKRRKRRGTEFSRGGTGHAPQAGGYGPWSARQSQSTREYLNSVLCEVDADPSAAGSYAQLFLGPYSPVATSSVIEMVRTFAREIVTAVVQNGWLPSDLAEITRRRLSADHAPALAALLVEESDRYSADRVARAWRDNVAGLQPVTRADPRTATGLERMLGLLSVLRLLPRIATIIPPPGTPANGAGSTAGIDPKLLGRVRALLAKAESTEFVEEAEALSAKAQELISRYALDRLLVTEHVASDHNVTTSRMWIDSPYLLAKAMLIDAVASANRCRSLVSERLGFSTIVGEATDVEAVELLSTSLLVQASSAMLGHGSLIDGRGTSRTRSFRQSFLVSYAIRIGERLRAATETATAETGKAGELVPVLRRQAERIDAAVDEMFPDVVSRQTSVSNRLGWAAGRAAADLALLDTRVQVASGSGGRGSPGR